MTDTTDPRPTLHHALDQAAAVVAGVRADQLRGPTPCAGFDVEKLLSHTVGVGRRVASLGRGEPQEGEAFVDGLAADEWTKAFNDARQDAFASWADDEILGRDLVLPWATLPGVVCAQVYAMELTVHAWDLAVATDQLGILDPTLAEVTLTTAVQMVPAVDRPAEVPFGPAVEVGPEATAYERLVAHLGRQPAGISNS